MKINIAAVVFLMTLLLVIYSLTNTVVKVENHESETPVLKSISNTIEKGENLFDIFKKHGLDMSQLFSMREASANVHRLRDLYPGQPYRITVDENSCVTGFEYWIDDDSILNITRTDAGFIAKKTDVVYEKRILSIGNDIRDNLIASMGKGNDNLLLALQMSDIFAWDIDFTSDLRNGDTFKIVAEGLYLDGQFKKYGDILSAEFVNNGKQFKAYRFEVDGRTDYYDENGNALKKAFLKAPLNFRRISSTFSRGRFHPVLKIYRPHRGIDYAAPAGSPVSAIGDGIITFAGYRGQYGKLIIIKHPNGYQTFYGHLSRFAKGLGKGDRINQGDVIGKVGSTGLATGPHLHYEVRINGKPVNPLGIAQPRGASVPKQLMASFRQIRTEMDNGLAAISLDSIADSRQPSRPMPGS